MEDLLVSIRETFDSLRHQIQQIHDEGYLPWDGFDWTELAVRWGLIGEEDVDLLDDSAEEVLARKLVDLVWDWDSGLDHKKCDDLRAYCLAMAAEDPGFRWPVWIALAAIENDVTLAKFFSNLVRMMWT